MIRRISLLALGVALALPLAGCPSSGTSTGGGGSSATSSGAACSNGQVDLTKLAGDWIATAPLDDFDGKVPGSQYRLRFAAPMADGTVKALMAWRMDTRPFTGKLEKNALGYKIKLIEDMNEEVIKQLREQNNQDPNVRMRAALEINAAEKDCLLELNDNYQSFLGEKTIEKTSMGSMKLQAFKGASPMSFVRCDAAKTIYFDGKAEDDQGRPRVNVVADKLVTIRSTADPKQLPQGCVFTGEVYVDGMLAKEKVPSTLGKEKGVDAKGKEAEIDAVIFETQITVPQGATHPVELHIWGECGAENAKEKKLVASLCNFAATR